MNFKDAASPARIKALLAGIASLLLAFGALVSPVHTQPAFAAGNNLTISSAATSNVSASAGVFEATGASSVLNADELVAALASTSTVVRATGTITISADIISNSAHSVTFEAGGTIDVGGKVTATRVSIFVSSSVLVRQTAPIETPELSLHGPARARLEHPDNIIGAVAAGSTSSPVSLLSLTIKQGGLRIGDVNSLSGVTATDAVTIITTSGNLLVERPVEARIANGNAVRLFANRAALVDEVGDGQILISGTGTVTVAAGARALLYSGDKSLSTGLVDLVGEANVRERVDALTSLTTLNSLIDPTGVFALFRSATQDITVTPAPNYTGPILNPLSGEFAPGSTVELSGMNLDQVTAASIDSQAVAISDQQPNSLRLQLPQTLTPGVKDLELTSTSGKVTVQGFVRISATAVGPKSYWTQARPDGKSVKFFAKSPVGQGKVQFFVDGREVAWVRAVDATDPKLRVITTDGPMAGVSYLVRTVELNPGKNRFEIRVNGERVWRATYLPQR